MEIFTGQTPGLSLGEVARETNAGLVTLGAGTGYHTIAEHAFTANVQTGQVFVATGSILVGLGAGMTSFRLRISKSGTCTIADTRVETSKGQSYLWSAGIGGGTFAMQVNLTGYVTGDGTLTLTLDGYAQGADANVQIGNASLDIQSLSPPT